jgi:hypothetical protein
MGREKRKFKKVPVLDKPQRHMKLLSSMLLLKNIMLMVRLGGSRDLLNV